MNSLGAPEPGALWGPLTQAAEGGAEMGFPWVPALPKIFPVFFKPGKKERKSLTLLFPMGNV